MPTAISNLTLTRKDRLKDLKARERGHFDLEFLKAMPAEMRNSCFAYLDRSTSQLRQDLFALSMLGFPRNGYFVEFGATDGCELSNTWLMEREFGWRGILSEPARGWHEALKANRACHIDTRCVWKTSGAQLDFVATPRSENSGIASFVESSRRPM